MVHGNWAETSGESGFGDRELPDSQEELRRALSWEVIAGHRERLMGLVRRRLPNAQDAQDAEDCVQEAMLRAAVCGDLDPERIGPFLTSVALRLCVDNHREQERSRRLLPRAADVRTPETPDEGVCDRDFGRWLLRQVHLLRGRERQVVLARAHGISTLEFARIHQISVKAAEGAFTRGRARLRQICARAMDGVVA